MSAVQAPRSDAVDGPRTAKLFERLGYAGDHQFNRLNGHRRFALTDDIRKRIARVGERVQWYEEPEEVA